MHVVQRTGNMQEGEIGNLCNLLETNFLTSTYSFNFLAMRKGYLLVFPETNHF
jgi:hypothetical protein